MKDVYCDPEMSKDELSGCRGLIVGVMVSLVLWGAVVILYLWVMS